MGLSDDEAIKQLRIGEPGDCPIRPEAFDLRHCDDWRLDGYVSRSPPNRRVST
jgi:hypothetical protein